jgi:anti-anti-sigma factor
MANDDYEHRVVEEADCTIVMISGEIDMSNADDLSKALDEAAARGLPVVVDATELAFIDSAGFAAIQRAIEMATVYLLVPPGCPTARGFAVSGLTQVVETFGSRSALRRRFEGSDERDPKGP